MSSKAEREREWKRLACKAAGHAVEAEQAKLTDWERQHLMFGGNLSADWAVYDWYVLARHAKDAKVIVRAFVGRQTKEVIVETNPVPASPPDRRWSMLAYALVAPLIAGAVFALVGYLFNPERWQTPDDLALLFLLSWAPWQVVVLIFVHNVYASAPITLPDGTLLFVTRARLKRSARGPGE